MGKDPEFVIDQTGRVWAVELLGFPRGRRLYLLARVDDNGRVQERQVSAEVLADYLDVADVCAGKVTPAAIGAWMRGGDLRIRKPAIGRVALALSWVALAVAVGVLMWLK